METSEAIHPEKSGQVSRYSKERTLGHVRSVETDHNVMVFRCDHASVVVTFVNDEVIRFKAFFTHDPDLSTTVAVVNQSRLPMSQLETEETPDAVTLTSGSLRLSVNKHPFQIRIYTKDGKLVYQEESMTFDSKGAFRCSSKSFDDAHFYGLGEKTSYLDKRNERYEMWNSDVYAPHVPEIEALYTSIPYMIHFRGGLAYGIFLDNPGRTVFDMRNSTDSYVFQTTTGEFDFYFIYGPTMKEVITRYTGVTGRMSIPPKWALGYHQSRYSYMNQEEVLQLARTFREKSIPCDVIHLDIHYMDEYRVFTFDKVRFPDPMGMMKELKEMGFHIVPIVDPGVKRDPKYPVYQEGIHNDFFCKKIEGDLFTGNVWPGESAFPDFTEDTVGEWWGEKHKFYVDHGIQGIWNDMNEPAVFNESKTMDLDVVHKNNGNPKTHDELHNLYGLLMSKATYEGLKKQLAGDRPFVLTRASYAGVQRVAALWTGDNRSFWEHLQMAMPMVMNLGLSGVPFSGPDIGGFAHHATGELLTRWTQMGVLFPFCRNHSAIDTLRQEPWSFGPEVEEVCRKYIGLRYQWMPLLYTLFYEASQSGLPVMRPLILEYPNDSNLTNLCDEFLVGPDVLVAPIYRPDTEYRAVYLPEGVWYNYWTGERYEGKQNILVHAPLDTLPLFVRAGGFIPEQDVVQYAAAPTGKGLRIQVYAGSPEEESSFTLYEDDGHTFQYEQGVFNVVDFKLKQTGRRMTLNYTYRERGFADGVGFVFVIKHAAFVPRSVHGLDKMSIEALHQTAQGWAYDEKTNDIVIKVDSKSDSATLVIEE